MIRRIKRLVDEQIRVDEKQTGPIKRAHQAPGWRMTRIGGGASYPTPVPHTRLYTIRPVAQQRLNQVFMSKSENILLHMLGMTGKLYSYT